jgi:type IV pilus assembly protein PilO
MFDRILFLPLNQRLLIYGGVCVLVALLYAVSFYLPRSRDIASNQEKMQTLETELTQLQAQVKNKAKTTEEITEVEGQFQQLKAQLPEQKEIPELLRQVSNLGRESGLEVVLFRQRAEALRELYAEVPVEMAVRGGYHQVALFFDKVRHLDRIVNVSDLSIKSPQPSKEQVSLEASFFATTYRFLSDEERERIAKEKAETEKKKGKKK